MLAISLFVPNKMSKELLMKELEVTETKGKTLFNIWFFLLRYVIPVTVIIVFLNAIGVFKCLHNKKTEISPSFYYVITVFNKRLYAL